MNRWIYNHHDLKPVQLLMIKTTEHLSLIVKNTIYWVEFSQFYYILSQMCVEGLYNLCSVHHRLFLDVQENIYREEIQIHSRHPTFRLNFRIYCENFFLYYF